MKDFSVQEHFDQAINDVWNSQKYNFEGYENEVVRRGFAIPARVNYGGLMFVGLNPSYSPENDKGPGYYPLTGEDLHKYFSRFREISDKTGLDWSHVDLMFVRETSQKFIENIKEGNPFLPFLQKQYDVAKRIIRKAKPKIIVVNNMLAYTWLINDDAIRHQFVFDEALGTYKIIGGELDGTPVFFTSMLTGQRALDNGSYERLIWHIRFVWDKTNN